MRLAQFFSPNLSPASRQTCRPDLNFSVAGSSRSYFIYFSSCIWVTPKLRPSRQICRLARVRFWLKNWAIVKNRQKCSQIHFFFKINSQLFSVEERNRSIWANYVIKTNYPRKFAQTGHTEENVGRSIEIVGVLRFRHQDFYGGHSIEIVGVLRFLWRPIHRNRRSTKISMGRSKRTVLGGKIVFTWVPARKKFICFASTYYAMAWTPIFSCAQGDQIGRISVYGVII
jgi:hypothetical protein